MNKEVLLLFHTQQGRKVGQHIAIQPGGRLIREITSDAQLALHAWGML